MNYEAIRLAYPNAKTIDDTAGVFDFDGNPIAIDQKIVDVKVAKLEAAHAAKKYQRERAARYPSWQDQLDNIFHNGIDSWKADIQEIKDQYPKP